MSPQREKGCVAGRLGYIGPFILLWALAHLLFTAIHHPEVFLRLQVDADGYMRLLRARDLMETGVWFDPRVERSSWPFGEVHHWTRPGDLPSQPPEGFASRLQRIRRAIWDPTS